MHDLKNISLAWMSSITSLFAAIDSRNAVTIISAVILPVIFFTIGKTADVLLQIYFRKLDAARRSGEETK